MKSTLNQGTNGNIVMSQKSFRSYSSKTLAYKILGLKRKRRLQKIDEGGTEFREGELCMQFPGSVVHVEVCQ